MDNGLAVKVQSHAPSKTKNNLKTTGTVYSVLRKNAMQKIIAQFLYRNPKNNEEYTVQRQWFCKSPQDAEHTVKYYGMKTGAFNAKYVMEDMTNEENKQSTSSITAKEENQTQSVA